jgi:hypothetical protein
MKINTARTPNSIKTVFITRLSLAYESIAVAMSFGIAKLSPLLSTARDNNKNIHNL